MSSNWIQDVISATRSAQICIALSFKALAKTSIGYTGPLALSARTSRKAAIARLWASACLLAVDILSEAAAFGVHAAARVVAREKGFAILPFILGSIFPPTGFELSCWWKPVFLQP